MKPILFNTEMVRAILDNRKNVTRRVAKIKINGGYIVDHAYCETVNYPEKNIDGICANFYEFDGFYKGAAKPPYQIDDILYVRETFAKSRFESCLHRSSYEYGIWYKADGESERYKYDWKPSIHMPKEAARVFLRVTDVRVERLQDMKLEDFMLEGVMPVPPSGEDFELEKGYQYNFSGIWDGTIKHADRECYGWNANPWVWVIEFERITKEEAMKYEAD